MESIIKSTPVTGKGWTVIQKVNVRSMASVYSGWITQIRYPGSEVEVTAEVINSSGETWYEVRLYLGYVGYIRGNLLRVNIVPVEPVVEQVIIQAPPKTETPKVIYVVVESEADVPKDGEVIYITQEQAEQLGIG